MNARERAEEIAKRNGAEELFHCCGQSGANNEAIDAIEAAIRAAEDEKLEEAARLFENDPEFEYPATAATMVRSLKSGSKP